MINKVEELQVTSFLKPSSRMFNRTVIDEPNLKVIITAEVTPNKILGYKKGKLVEVKSIMFGYMTVVYKDGVVYQIGDGLKADREKIENLLDKEQRLQVSKAVLDLLKNIIKYYKPMVIARFIDSNKAKLRRYLYLKEYLEAKGWTTTEIVIPGWRTSANPPDRITWLHKHPAIKDVVIEDDMSKV
jgi:hypothetical protein